MITARCCRSSHSLRVTFNDYGAAQHDRVYCALLAALKAKNCVDPPFFPSVFGNRSMRTARPAPLGTDALSESLVPTGWLGSSPAARFTGNAPGFFCKQHRCGLYNFGVFHNVFRFSRAFARENRKTLWKTPKLYKPHRCCLQKKPGAFPVNRAAGDEPSHPVGTRDSERASVPSGAGRAVRIERLPKTEGKNGGSTQFLALRAANRAQYTRSCCAAP